MIHQRCGGHLGKALDKNVKRRVRHQKFECLDCAANDAMRVKFHGDERHAGKAADCVECDKYVFWVESHSPIDP